MTELLNDFLSGSAAWGVLLTLAAFGLGVLINKAPARPSLTRCCWADRLSSCSLSVCNIPYDYIAASAAPVSYLLLPATVAWPCRCMKNGICCKRTPPPSWPVCWPELWQVCAACWHWPWLLDLNHEQYATLLPKSVTTAISMDVPASWAALPP